MLENKFFFKKRLCFAVVRFDSTLALVFIPFFLSLSSPKNLVFHLLIARQERKLYLMRT